MTLPDTMLNPAGAENLIRGRVAPLPVESRPLLALAGAVLAEEVRAERDLPPYDRVTMDGIALNSAAWRAGTRAFRIGGTQAAGAPPLTLPATDACLEVMTGAMLPRGCDCVVPVERIEVADGWAKLADDVPVEPQRNVHTRGLDCRAGELLLESGTRLGGTELAVLASAGRPRAQVRAEPRIMVVGTGDELVDPGEPIHDWQVRRSNSYALRGALALRGFSRVAEDHVRDDVDLLRERLALHLSTHDALVLTGGVSMGRYDHVPAVLQEIGVEQVFHRVAQRPGKPLWFGVGPAGQPVFGLPGNPVSALVCLVRYVVPGLLALMGGGPPPMQALPLAVPFKVNASLWHFVPVRIGFDSEQGSVATPQATHGSGDFVSLLGTDGFIELSPGPAEYPAGHVAPLYRW